MTPESDQTSQPSERVPEVASAGLFGELSPAQSEALSLMSQHGDLKDHDYYHWPLMKRAQWVDESIEARAPLMVTIAALERRGAVECYEKSQYHGHGEYDVWQQWRLSPNKELGDA